MNAAGRPPEQTPEGWSEVADHYDRVIAPYLAGFAEDALRATGLSAGERVLDVAAGSGALSLLAARAGARVLATDFAPGMLALLRERAAAAKLDLRAEVMDGEALAVEDGAFDAAYSNFGVIFFPDPRRGLREMRRALRDGGRAAVTSWPPPDRVAWVQLFGSAVREAFPDAPAPPMPRAFSLSSAEGLGDAMRDAGFRNVRVETLARPWEMGTPEEAWRILSASHPATRAMMARLGAANVARLREVVLDRLRARAGGTAVRFVGEAFLAVGER